MKEKNNILETKRLIVSPMSDEALRARIDAEKDDTLKTAYSEMLKGCTDHPDDRLWYTLWTVCLAEGGQHIGDLSFKGPAEYCTVEIGYGIDEPFRNQSYATEAADALLRWAFEHDNVFFAEAETAPDNAASQRVLEKLYFEKYGEGEEGPRFVKEKPVVMWAPIYILLGTLIGLLVGIITKRFGFSILGGFGIGLLFGFLSDLNNRRKRVAARKIRAERK